MSLLEDKILPVVRAELAAKGGNCVFVHADCDDVEPADETMAASIERQLNGRLPVTVHAVVPAWELEAWWFLWPDACARVCTSWRLPDKYVGRKVGRIVNAKEELRRALRTGGPRRKARQYEPSDAPAIAAAVRKLGVIHHPRADSASFARLTHAARQCCEE